MKYDIIVIGGGPGGYVSAIYAAQRGKKVMLAEAEHLGGVCLNKGCIPTKALLKCANSLTEVRHLGELGITAGDVRFDFAAMMVRKQAIVKRLSSGVGSLLAANGVDVVTGWAEVMDPHTVSVGADIYQADNIILANGSVPLIPPIKGADNACCMTSDDALALTELPKSVTIIGGGVIGVEFAFVFAQLGCQVTTVEMLDQILSMADRDAIREIDRALRKLGVKVITGAKVLEITESDVVYECGSEHGRVAGERVLLAIGRRSNADKAMLERLGIEHDRGRVNTDAHMQTNVPGVYAIGDINGKLMLAHVASEEGITAVDHICGEDRTMSYDAIPQCVYSVPEVAWVGLTEQDAKGRGLNIKTGIFPLSANGKAQVEGAEAGFVKIIADQVDDTILGVHMVGPHSTDMIMEGVLAVKQCMTTGELVSAIHPHPSVTEAVLEAAMLTQRGFGIHSMPRKKN